MNVSKIMSFVGGVMLSVSCHNSPRPYVSPTQRAFNHAVRYMTRDEARIMQHNANKQIHDFTGDVSDKIFYWDSLWQKELVSDAFVEGKNYAQDSINGIIYPKRQFVLPLDTVINTPRSGKDIILNTKVNIGESIGGEKLYQHIKHEPKSLNDSVERWINRNNHVTHYYDVVGSVAAQRDAYNRGITFALKKHSGK